MEQPSAATAATTATSSCSAKEIRNPKTNWATARESKVSWERVKQLQQSNRRTPEAIVVKFIEFDCSFPNIFY